jgi:hypothetical protein
MVQRVSTLAFEGIEARAVDVQVAPGLPAFAIVGLPDKAVSEARERVRSALIASGLALPAGRITVNLAIWFAIHTLFKETTPVRASCSAPEAPVGPVALAA